MTRHYNAHGRVGMRIVRPIHHGIQRQGQEPVKSSSHVYPGSRTCEGHDDDESLRNYYPGVIIPIIEEKECYQAAFQAGQARALCNMAPGHQPPVSHSESQNSGPGLN